MRGEMVAHQDARVGIGIAVIKQVVDLVSPGDSGALWGYRDRTPTWQRLGAQQDVGCPAPYVFIIVPLGRARLGWPGWARFLHERHRLVIHVAKGAPWSLGTRRESKDRFQGGHKVGLVLRGHHPILVSVRLEEIFFVVCRTVS